MRKPLLPIFLLAWILAAPAPDKSQSAKKAQPDRPQKAPDPYVERFKQLDADHDGFVSPAEWPLEPESFKRVDRNQDGRLSALCDSQPEDLLCRDDVDAQCNSPLKQHSVLGGLDSGG